MTLSFITGRRREGGGETMEGKEEVKGGREERVENRSIYM